MGARKARGPLLDWRTENEGAVEAPEHAFEELTDTEHDQYMWPNENISGEDDPKRFGNWLAIALAKNEGAGIGRSRTCPRFLFAASTT
jgi:hypothetical protein